MSTLITGANGFVGSALWRRLAQLRIPHTAAVRETSPGAASNVVAVGDIGATTDWSAALTGAGAIVHLAARVHVVRENAADPLAAFRAVNVEGTMQLARQAVASGVRRLVFVSTIKVNGESTFGVPFKESDAPRPDDAYAQSKLEAEVALKNLAAETGLELIILRPPLIYGPGVGGNFRRLLDAVARGLPMPFGSIHNRRSLLYVENMVDAIIACLTHPGAAGMTFLLSDGASVSTAKLATDVAFALGSNVRLLPVPPLVLRAAATLLGRGAAADRLLGSLEVDNSLIASTLGWTPRISLAEGLAATAAWYRASSTSSKGRG